VIHNINIWTVQWIEIDKTGAEAVIVELHLSYESAKSRVDELFNITSAELEAIRGYATNLISSSISISAFFITPSLHDEP